MVNALVAAGDRTRYRQEMKHMSFEKRLKRISDLYATGAAKALKSRSF